MWIRWMKRSLLHGGRRIEESLERDASREGGTWWSNRGAVRAGHSNMWLTVWAESRLQCSHERGNRLERR